MRLTRPSVLRAHRVDLAWAGLASASLVTMVAWPQWQGLPLHLAFLSLTVACGLMAWRWRTTSAILVVLVIASAALMGRAASAGGDWIDLSELPFLSALVLIVVWHSQRRQLALEAAQESKQRTRSILESANEAFIAFDAAGRITDWNPEAERTFGWTRAEALGRDFAETIVPPQLHGTFTSAVARSLETCENPFAGQRTELTALRCNGEEFPVEFSASTVRHGDSASFYAFLRDITRRRLAEETLRDREEQLCGLVDNIPGVVYRCVADPEWPMVLIGDEVEVLTGYPAADFLEEARSFASLIDPRDSELVSAASDAAIGEGRPFELEYRIRHADGGVRWVHERGQAVRGPDGSVLWLDGVMLDVTERKRTEEELRKSREDYRAILETANDAFLAFDPDGRICEWNRAAERMFGWQRDEAIGGTIAETVIPPALLEPTAAAIASYLEARDSPLFARRTQAAARRRDGTEFPVEFTVRAIEREGAVRFNVFVQDIGERRRAEDALRQAESSYRTLVESLPLITYVDALDETSSAVYVSPQIEPLLGYSVEEWLADPELFVKLLHPDDRERVLAEVERTNASGELFAAEYRLVARDGRVLWFEDRALAIHDADGKPTSAKGYLVDITERKRAEEALSEAERKFRTLVEQLPLVTYVEELGQASASYISPQIERLCGYTAEEWSNERDFFGNVLHPGDRERVLAAFARFQETGEPVDCEYRLIARDGRIVWCRDSAVLARDGRGRPLYTQGFMVDVTERRESEEAARRLAAIVEWSDDAIVGTSLDGVITAWNRGAEQLYGFAAEEAIGQRLSLIVPGDGSHEASALLERIRHGGRVHRHETVRLHKDGRRLDVALTISPILDETGAPVGASAIARDIGDRKRAEAERERLLVLEREQNERLRELDRLKDEFIALVSHELRTPLTSIHGYLELVLDGEAGEISETQRRFLGVVGRNAERLGRIVGDLLLVAQIEAGTLSLELDQVALGEVARQSVETARPLAEKNGVALALNAEPARAITADRARLAQVIDNLVTNAIKFTPPGGSVEVAVSQANGAVLLDVSDTGMGISEEEQRRLFERFFRTESATALAIPGTGLGLAIAKAIVDAHHGQIEVESSVGSGTTFRVRLPLAESRVAGGNGSIATQA